MFGAGAAFFRAARAGDQARRRREHRSSGQAERGRVEDGQGISARDEGGEGTTGWRASAYECERGDDVRGMKMYVHEEQMDSVGSWMLSVLSTAARRKRAHHALVTLLSC